MFNFHYGTLPFDSLRLTRALLDVTPSSAVMRLILKTIIKTNSLSKKREYNWSWPFVEIVKFA